MFQFYKNATFQPIKLFSNQQIHIFEPFTSAMGDHHANTPETKLYHVADADLDALCPAFKAGCLLVANSIASNEQACCRTQFVWEHMKSSVSNAFTVGLLGRQVANGIMGAFEASNGCRARVEIFIDVKDPERLYDVAFILCDPVLVDRVDPNTHTNVVLGSMRVDCTRRKITRTRRLSPPAVLELACAKNGYKAERRLCDKKMGSAFLEETRDEGQVDFQLFTMPLRIISKMKK
jgi:hypothetical protein